MAVQCMMRNPWTILLYTREEGRRAYVQAALPPLAATDCFLPESAAAMVAGGDKRQSATQKTPVAEGMPDIRPGARRYIAISRLLLLGPAPPPLPFLSLFFSPIPQERGARAGAGARKKNVGNARTPCAVASRGVGWWAVRAGVMDGLMACPPPNVQYAPTIRERDRQPSLVSVHSRSYHIWFISSSCLLWFQQQAVVFMLQSINISFLSSSQHHHFRLNHFRIYFW
jgi:hypothetical protein